MNRDHSWLTDVQFAKLRPLLSKDTRGKPRVDDRRAISGIVYVIKSGGHIAVRRVERGELNQAIGRSRGGRTIKIYALGCRPVAVLLAGGNVADCSAANF